MITDETWADVDDVDRFTGITVDEDTLIRAQDIIEIFCGFTIDATGNMTERNLRLLNRAVAYQAGWMAFKPDLYTHHDVDNFSQDGASHTPGHVNANLIAPMALRCLRRLTTAQKPLRVRRRYGEYDSTDWGPRDSTAADDNKIWTPM